MSQLIEQQSRRMRRRNVLIGLGGAVGLAGIGGGYAWWHLAQQAAQQAAKQAHMTLNSGVIASLQWLPDGRRLIAQGAFNSAPSLVQGWDTSTGKQFLNVLTGPYISTTNPEYTLHDSQVMLSPKGDVFAICLNYIKKTSYDLSLSRLLIYDTATGQHVFFDHTFSAYIGDLTWSPDGTRMVLLIAQVPSGQDYVSDGTKITAQLWDFSQKRLVATCALPGGMRWWVTWSPDGTSIITMERFGSVITWNAELGQQQEFNANPLLGIDSIITPLKWAPDGKTIALFVQDIPTGSGESTVLLWHPPLRSVTSAGNSLQKVIVELDQDIIYDLAWSSDSRYLALAGRTDVYIIDLAGHVLFTYTSEELDSSSSASYGESVVAWSPDGRHLASTGGGDSTIQIWHPSYS